METKTTGTVIAASKQWWLKINTKPIRSFGTDGAIYPHIIKVTYSVNGQNYSIRKWISAGEPVPAVGSVVQVMYSDEKPAKAKVVCR